jgi:hypothetical protein
MLYENEERRICCNIIAVQKSQFKTGKQIALTNPVQHEQHGC